MFTMAVCIWRNFFFSARHKNKASCNSDDEGKDELLHVFWFGFVINKFGPCGRMISTLASLNRGWQQAFGWPFFA